jgi:hypothetical protein
MGIGLKRPTFVTKQISQKTKEIKSRFLKITVVEKWAFTDLRVQKKSILIAEY